MAAIDPKDRTVLVTGANRGIGLTIAEAFLEAGVKKLYAAVRDPKSVEGLVADFGERVVPIEFDLGSDSLIEAAAKAAPDVEIVVNNAGVLKTSTTLDAHALDSLQFEFDKNVFGLLRTARAFAPVLEKNGGGAFVQLNSVVSMKTFPEFATYSASKAASYAITQGLRADLREKGIHVVSVHPGPIATDMGRDAGLEEVAEPPRVVADGILEALREERFHVFPDSMAKQIEQVYSSFATNVVEADLSEA